MQLYNYFRSSASYRVRIALALKGLDYDYQAVHLARNEQFNESYAAVSAARLVPLLRDGEAVLTQSMAIIEYLDEVYPEPPLLPGDALARAYVRGLAQDIACEIHPLNNLRVLRYLVKELGASEDAGIWVARELRRIGRPFRHRGNHRYLIPLSRACRRALPGHLAAVGLQVQPYPRAAALPPAPIARAA